MADEGGEKTEEASDKKIQDSRKQGQVWKSKDLTGVFVFLVGLGIVKGTWSNVETKVNELFQFTFEHMAHPQEIEKATLQCMMLALMDVIVLCVPVAFGCATLSNRSSGSTEPAVTKDIWCGRTGLPRSSTTPSVTYTV